MSGGQKTMFLGSTMPWPDPTLTRPVRCSRGFRQGEFSAHRRTVLQTRSALVDASLAGSRFEQLRLTSIQVGCLAVQLTHKHSAAGGRTPCAPSDGYDCARRRALGPAPVRASRSWHRRWLVIEPNRGFRVPDLTELVLPSSRRRCHTVQDWMKMIGSHAAAALLLVTFLTPARAADVPVIYSVDETTLKTAIAGTPLTFQLYGDRSCTTLVHTQVVNAESVEVISRLKRLRPKGAAKPPRTDDVRTTLTGVTPTTPLYLRVTGTGIAPAGGACQVQAAGGLGPTPGLLVKDSNGRTLGIFNDSGAPGALRNVGGRFARVPTAISGFTGGSVLLYYNTSNDCSGTALIYIDDISLAAYGVVIDKMLYVPATTGTSTLVTSQLYKNGTLTDQAACDATLGVGISTFRAPEGCCQATAFNAPVGTLQTEDLSGFVPPFHIE